MKLNGTKKRSVLFLTVKRLYTQPGSWSAPGGKYKKFPSSNTNLSISWSYHLNYLSFKGDVGDILKNLLIYICTSKAPIFEVSVIPDPVRPVCDDPSRVSQLLPFDLVSNVSETNCEIGPSSVDTSTASDSTTMDQLQEFIDSSYQKSVMYKIPFAQTADSSTPFKPGQSNILALEEQFSILKENIVSKVMALSTKILEQTQIIENNNKNCANCQGKIYVRDHDYWFWSRKFFLKGPY